MDPLTMTYEPDYKQSKVAHYKTLEARMEEYRKSISDPKTFWEQFANRSIDWFAPPQQTFSGSFEKGDIAWFLDGKLNVSYNCVDRWARDTPDKVAIIWEGNNPDESKQITYRELLQEVCRMANVLKRYGVRKGDCVAIYMPMIPEAAYAMLACARLGAPHSVIFAGFSKIAIRDRVLDANCQFVITADEGLRAKKVVPLKQTVDEGLAECPDVKTVFVWKRTGSDVNMQEGRDVWLADAMARERPYCPCEVMDSEDILFLLYTSGSTGKPKGVVHTTAGYLCYTMCTHKNVFDLQPDDVYACVADVGWITGHSYIVYGPLANNATTLMFESVPVYPDAGRYWHMVEKHKITQFYTAPTAIRLLMKYDEKHVTKYDRSSLKILGTVGEPINPEVWVWYFNVVGERKCPIVDTWWQTETGGIMITPLPGCTPTKPGSATLPMFGIEPAIMDKDGNEIKTTEAEGILVIKQPWPSCIRTVFGDHQRMLKTYMTAYPGYYFTGDGCKRDKDGYYWITGRVDDVLNISGHRLGTAEIESAIVEHPDCAEAACVGMPHALKGQCMFAYVIVKEGVEMSEQLAKEIRQRVRKDIGAFAAPEEILLVDAVPKTRSGKIMRRILRKIACKEYDSLGDISTLSNSAAVEAIINKRKAMPEKKK